MKKILPCLSLVCMLFNPASPLALSGGQHYAERCIGLIINGEYDAAFSFADSVMHADTLDPLAPLFRLTAIGVRDIDFDTLLDSSGFLKAYGMAEERIAAYEETNGVSSYSKMLAGFSRGFYAAFYLRLNSYFAAMRNGFQSLDLLEEAYALDSTNADPLFLTGLYEYAKGELKRRLWWVLFWYPGSKKRGVERLRTCMNSGRFAASAAALSLAEIYVREDKPDDCQPIVEKLARNFPKSRFSLWAKAKYFESRRVYYDAGLVYELLAASYASETAGRYNALLTRSLQAQMLVKSGQKKEAADSCRSILREKTSGRGNAVIKSVRKLLQDIHDSERQ